ncbi:pentatricopeptide repeat-containing protein MRL1, chloroplastic isoform X2 [Amborella trichopoda]|uniref:pentatricopeptide repeat-containing protein MRL1, chloroplastic isoform X2 n=1 Tax=Amborella trichopoda TaxID=13333 RepID=UPI0009C18C82|nr:pentatricopeptide repeat-containing protein MRL1, chloroplastic isoform X2 [Amborella trichopoda]|eukprot:XP_020520327.1 pentatricopeptide repeat-containing protein MRL1, chloroplastic isoform X2 [Amborella trichopoda]
MEVTFLSRPPLLPFSPSSSSSSKYLPFSSFQTLFRVDLLGLANSLRPPALRSPKKFRPLDLRFRTHRSHGLICRAALMETSALIAIAIAVVAAIRFYLNYINQRHKKPSKVITETTMEAQENLQTEHSIPKINFIEYDECTKEVAVTAAAASDVFTVVASNFKGFHSPDLRRIQNTGGIQEMVKIKEIQKPNFHSAGSSARNPSYAKAAEVMSLDLMPKKFGEKGDCDLDSSRFICAKRQLDEESQGEAHVNTMVSMALEASHFKGSSDNLKRTHAAVVVHLNHEHRYGTNRTFGTLVSGENGECKGLAMEPKTIDGSQYGVSFSISSQTPGTINSHMDKNNMECLSFKWPHNHNKLGHAAKVMNNNAISSQTPGTTNSHMDNNNKECLSFKRPHNHNKLGHAVKVMNNKQILEGRVLSPYDKQGSVKARKKRNNGIGFTVDKEENSVQNDVGSFPPSRLPNESEKEKDDLSEYLRMYNRWLKHGRLNDCIQLLESIDEKALLDMDKIYHTRFLNMCKTQKAVDEAFRFVQLVRKPSLSTFNMLLSVYASSHDSEGAFRVLALVKEAGLKADCKLYTTLISTCAKSGKVDGMFEVFHEMVNTGVEPNVHTYGALIDGCARAGQIAKAFGAYGIMRSKVDRALEVYKMVHGYNIKGCPDVYTIAVNSCSEKGDLDFALRVYDDMKENGVKPDEVFFSALIDVAGHAGKLDVAFSIIQDAKNHGIQIGNILYSSVMGACRHAKSWQRALELYEDIKSIKLLPTVSTLNALITSLCEGDQLHKAVEVLEETREAGMCPNSITYSILFVECEKKDETECALKLLSYSKKDGIGVNLIMCGCFTGLCLRRYEKASALGEPILAFSSGNAQIDNQWTSWALMVYRETVSAGIIPTMEVFSQVLGCLQIPYDPVLRNSLLDNQGISIDVLRCPNVCSLVDGFGEYDPRAFSLLEEAASLGVVPGVSFKSSPIIVDTRMLRIHTAEVYFLTVLKGLKHRLAAGAKLPNMTIILPIEKTTVASGNGDKTVHLSGRIGQALGALLRRLGLPYQGNESYGKIRISGLALKRWFQPKLALRFSRKQPEMSSPPTRLAKGITDQQHSIRTKNLSLSNDFNDGSRSLEPGINQDVPDFSFD